MRNLWVPENTVLEVAKGSEITSTIAEAVQISAENAGHTVRFEFGGVMISVCSNSIRAHIHRDWVRAMNGVIGKEVGPHPKPVLTNEERANDERIKAKNRRG